MGSLLLSPPQTAAEPSAVAASLSSGILNRCCTNSSSLEALLETNERDSSKHLGVHRQGAQVDAAPESSAADRKLSSCPEEPPLENSRPAFSARGQAQDGRRSDVRVWARDARVAGDTRLFSRRSREPQISRCSGCDQGPLGLVRAHGRGRAWPRSGRQAQVQGGARGGGHRPGSCVLRIPIGGGMEGGSYLSMDGHRWCQLSPGHVTTLTRVRVGSVSASPYHAPDPICSSRCKTGT